MIYVYLYIYIYDICIYILRRVLLERIRNKSRAIFSPSRSTGRSPEPPWDGAHGVVGHYQRYQWQALTFGSTGNSTSRTTMFHTVSRCCKYKQSIYLLLQLIYIIIKIFPCEDGIGIDHLIIILLFSLQNIRPEFIKWIT